MPDWRRSRVQFSVKPFCFEVEIKPFECGMQQDMTGYHRSDFLRLSQSIEHRRHWEKCPDHDRFDSSPAPSARPSDLWHLILVPRIESIPSYSSSQLDPSQLGGVLEMAIKSSAKLVSAP